MKTQSRRSESLNLVEIARRFPDDATARAFLEETRWPKGPVCPHCGSVNNSRKLTANPGKKIRPGLYQCRVETCAKQFTVTVGTVFEASKVSLSNWLIAWHLVCASKKGIAALELQRLLGIGSYRTAWFMLMRIRESLASGTFDGSPLKGTVEVDEALIGGSSTGNGGKYSTKIPVITAISRDGRAVSKCVDNLQTETLTPFVLAAVDPSAHLVTDKSHAYKRAAPTFASHQALNHTKKEFVRGTSHTGHVDNYISILKRAHFGTFHVLSKKYMQRYLVEFDFRYSSRQFTDGRNTVRGLATMGGKRLKLVDLRAAG